MERAKDTLRDVQRNATFPGVLKVIVIKRQDAISCELMSISIVYELSRLNFFQSKCKNSMQ